MTHNIRGSVWVYTGLWNKIKLFLTMDSAQRGEVLLGDRPRQGLRLSRAHTTEP